VVGNKKGGLGLLTNTWDWIRILGFLSYYFFTMSAVFGIVRKSVWLTKHKNLVFQLHTIAGWLGLLTLIGHMLILLVDQYMTFTIFEILIPFVTDYHTFGTSLGIVAFYFFAITLYTSDVLIMKMKFPVWKKIHFIVFPAWLFSLAHGLLVGTDSSNPFVLSLYISSLLVIIVLALLRNKTFQKKTSVVS